ncbi:MAG: RNA polymerase sigma factor SigJ [Nitriliruptorales bacterium]|nr:RNA polymerase sigma factor SigJ [Nitriliruptorales bacterium]
MLGSVTEAEDVVQDAFVRWSEMDQSQIRDPAAWLTTAVTRLSLDRLKSARRRRETYVGPWLPEPLATDTVDPADLAGTADSLTFAFLVILESLSPLERAVFVLHDVFGHPHAQIAQMLGRGPAAIRQVAARARRHLEQRQHRYDADSRRQREVTEAFLAACAGEDVEAMIGLLAPDVTFTGDGGGVVAATPRPVRGAGRVAKMLAGFWATGQRRGLSVEAAEINAEPGIVVRDGEDIESVFVFEVRDHRITAVRGVRNPEKLAGFARLRRGR